MEGDAQAVISNCCDEDEAAFVDAFFLPGGILDPEEDNGNNNGMNDDDATTTAEDNDSSQLHKPSLLFPSTSSGGWLNSATAIASSISSTPAESQNTASAAAWFGERLLMTETNATESTPLPTHNNQDFVDVIQPESYSSQKSVALLKPILSDTLSPAMTLSPTTIAESGFGLVVSGNRLHSIPDWIAPSQWQQQQQQPQAQSHAVVTVTTSNQQTLQALPMPAVGGAKPPPPPGFEKSLLLSSPTSSAFSPPKPRISQCHQQEMITKIKPLETATTPPLLTPNRPGYVGLHPGTSLSPKDSVAYAATLGPTKRRIGLASSNPYKNLAPLKQQQETGSPYRAAVVSKPMQTNNKANPNQGNRNINQQGNQGHPPQFFDQTECASSEAALLSADGSEDGSVGTSSHSNNSQGRGSGTPSDPSSIYSMEDDLIGEDEFLIHTEGTRRSSEESELNQILHSTSSSQSRLPLRENAAAASTTPRSGTGSMTRSSKDAFSVKTRKSLAAETEESRAKEAKNIIPQQQQQQTKAAATVQSGTTTKQKSSSRRQQLQQHSKNQIAPKANALSVPSESDKTPPDGLDSFLGVFVTATLYSYECVLYIHAILGHVFMWMYEILIPAIRQSVLTVASSAAHTLRGIFLLLLAAFHAYSFAADETLAQINLESAWIPYVSLVYAPTATRHVMNFVDLPHFTPHLVSSAVLCFLFRRPGGVSNSKQRGGPAKPTVEDIRNFLLRCCQLFIPFDLVMDGFSSVNTSIMTLSYTDRLLLAYVICVVRKGWMLVPCAWLSFAAQCLVAVYFPWKHILAEPILLFVLFSIGMASLNILRILEHWKQRAKKAIGKSA